jgi:hypothetical protein
MKKILALAGLVAVFALLIVPFVASAQTVHTNVWDPSIIKGPLITCTGDGSGGFSACQSFCDLVATFINVIYWGIGLVLWVLAPIFFAVGGVIYLIAGANAESISRARKTLIGTVIGVLIVVSAWLIINTFVTVIGIQYIGGFSSGTSTCQIQSQ